MTLATFRALGPKQRVRLATQQGIYLLHRPWLGGTLQLFFLPTVSRGIFIELSYEVSLPAFVLVNSFAEAASLEPYLDQLSLPPGMGYGAAQPGTGHKHPVELPDERELLEGVERDITAKLCQLAAPFGYTRVSTLPSPAGAPTKDEQQQHDHGKGSATVPAGGVA